LALAVDAAEIWMLRELVTADDPHVNVCLLLQEIE
jgi:hypothetical protein